MSNFFDQFDEKEAPSGNFFDQFDPPEAPKPERGAGGAVRDYGLATLQGAVNLGEGVVGLADLATAPSRIALDRIGLPVASVGDLMGDRFERTREILSDAKTDYAKAGAKAVADAEGFFGTLAALADNPDAAGQLMAENITMLLPGAAATRAASGARYAAALEAGLKSGMAPAAAAKAANIAARKAGTAAGLGVEGGMGAAFASGAAADELEGVNPDATLAQREAARLLGGGLGAVTSLATGKLLNIGAARQDAFGVGEQVRGGLLSRAGKGLEVFGREAVQESLQEGFEDLSAKRAANTVDDRVALADEQTPKNFALGLALGAGPGAVSGGAAALRSNNATGPATPGEGDLANDLGAATADIGGVTLTRETDADGETMWTAPGIDQAFPTPEAFAEWQQAQSQPQAPQIDPELQAAATDPMRPGEDALAAELRKTTAQIAIDSQRGAQRGLEIVVPTPYQAPDRTVAPAAYTPPDQNAQGIELQRRDAQVRSIEAQLADPGLKGSRRTMLQNRLNRLESATTEELRAELARIDQESGNVRQEEQSQDALRQGQAEEVDAARLAGAGTAGRGGDVAGGEGPASAVGIGAQGLAGNRAEMAGPGDGSLVSVGGREPQQQGSLKPTETAEDIEAGERRRLMKMIRASGIDITSRDDITREQGRAAARMAPGLFRKGGRTIDDVATDLYHAGFISETDFNDVDGGVQAARDLIYNAITKSEPVLSIEARDRWVALRMDEEVTAEDVADELGVDPNDESDMQSEGIDSNNRDDVLDYWLLEQIAEDDLAAYDRLFADYTDSAELMAAATEWINGRANESAEAGRGSEEERLAQIEREAAASAAARDAAGDPAATQDEVVQGPDTGAFSLAQQAPASTPQQSRTEQQGDAFGRNETAQSLADRARAQDARRNGTQDVPAGVDGGLFSDQGRQTDLTAATPAAPESRKPSPVPREDSGREPASWVIRNRETGEPVMETFDRKKVEALNTEKYEAVPIQKHLASLNKPSAQESEETSKQVTQSDVSRARASLTSQVQARINAMKGADVQAAAGALERETGVRLPFGKAKAREAVADAVAQFPQVTAERFGVPFDDDARRVFTAELEGRVLAEGSFGPVFTQFRGDAQGAIAKLTELQTGEAVAALNHPDVGEIDLVWGETSDDPSAKGTGLAKIVRWHPEVLPDLQGFISGLRRNPDASGPNRIRLESLNGKAVVRLDWEGQQKKWLLTAFEKNAGRAASTDTSPVDSRDDTASPATRSDKATPAQESSPAFTRSQIDEAVERAVQKVRILVAGKDAKDLRAATGVSRPMNRSDLEAEAIRQAQENPLTVADALGIELAPEVRAPLEQLYSASFSREGQTAESDPLTVIHNLTDENLLFADRMGGPASNRPEAPEWERGQVDKLNGILARQAGQEVPLRAVEAPRAMRDLSQTMETLLGRKAVFFESSDPRAPAGVYVSGGVLFVNADAKQPLRHVLGHEFTHSLEGPAAELHAILKARVLEMAKAGAFPAYEARLEKVYQRDGLPKLSRAKVENEFVADVMGSIMSDPKVLFDLKQRMEPSAFQRLVNAINAWIDGLMARLRGDDMRQSDFAQRTMRDLDGIKALVGDVLQATAEGQLRPAMGDAAMAGQPLFARNDAPGALRPDAQEADSFRQNLAKSMSSLRTLVSPISIGRTPAVLQRTGAPDLDISITRDVVRKATNPASRNHSVPMEVIERLPEELADPLLVIDAGKPFPARVILTEQVDARGKPVVVALHLEQREQRVLVNRIASAYGKDQAKDMQRWIDQGRVLYQANRSPEQVRLIGLQLPLSGSPAQGSTAKLLTEADIVNQNLPDGGVSRSGADVAFSRQDQASTDPDDMSTLLPQDWGGWKMWQRDVRGSNGRALKQNMYPWFINRFSEMERTVKLLKGKGVAIPDERNPSSLEKTFYGRTQTRLDDLKDDAKALFKVMNKAGVSFKQASDYLYAMHARERNAAIAERNSMFPDGGSGMTNRQAAKILADAAALPREQREALAEVSRVVKKINRQKLDLMREAGLISAVQYKALTTGYQNYVPLKSVVDPEEQGQGTGSGFDQRSTVIREAFGRASRAEDPLAVALMDAQQTFVRAEKNRVGRAVYDLILETSGNQGLISGPAGDYWRVMTPEEYPKLARKVKVPVMDPKTGKPQLDAKGKPVTTEDVQYVPSINDLYRRDEIFMARVDGELVVMEFKNKRLAKQLKNMAGEQLSATLRTFGAATKFFGRTLTMYNPEFALPNFVRDVQTAFLNAFGADMEDPKGFAFDVMKNLKAGLVGSVRGKNKGWMLEGSPLYREFLEAGGTTGAYGLTGVEDIKAEFESLVNQSRKGLSPNMAVTAGKKFIEKVERFNEVFENTTRLAIYKAARDRGLSKQESARLAKDTTVNFNQKGELQWPSAFYVFFNAAMQGNFAMLKAAGRSKITRGAMLGLMVMGLVESMTEDDDDEGEPLGDAAGKWSLGREMTKFLDDNTHIKIPIAYGYNVPYAMGRMLGRAIKGNASPAEALGVSLSAFMSSFLPTDSLVPSIAEPLLNVAKNETAFGSTIYRRSFGDDTYDPVAYRDYEEKALTKFMQALHKGFGGDRYSPNSIKEATGRDPFSASAAEALVKGYIGPQWRLAEGLVGVLAGDGPSNLNDVPIVRRFVNERSEHFYDSRFSEIAREADAARKTIQMLREDRQPIGSRFTDHQRRVIEQTRKANAVDRSMRKRIEDMPDGPQKDALETQRDVRVREAIRRYNEAFE